MLINMIKTYLARNKETAFSIVLHLLLISAFIVIAIGFLLIKVLLFATTAGMALMVIIQIVMWLFGQSSALLPNILILIFINILLWGITKLPGFFAAFLKKDQ